VPCPRKKVSPSRAKPSISTRPRRQSIATSIYLAGDYNTVRRSLYVPRAYLIPIVLHPEQPQLPGPFAFPQCLQRRARKARARRGETSASRGAAIQLPALLAPPSHHPTWASPPTSGSPCSPFEPRMILLNHMARQFQARRTWRPSWSVCDDLWLSSKLEEPCATGA